MKKWAKLKVYLQLLSIPLSLIFLAVLVDILWKTFHFPSQDAFLQIIKNFLAKYGLWVVLISSIAEGVLLVGNYFPGGVVIFFSVVSAGKNIPKAGLTVLVVAIGFYIAYAINYFLGKYGWYKLLVKFGLKSQLASAEGKVSKHSLKAILGSYWEPNFGSVTSTAAGILKLPLSKFLKESALGLIIWDTFWGVLVYSLGNNAIKLIFNVKLLVPLALAWILAIIIYQQFKKPKVYGTASQ